MNKFLLIVFTLASLSWNTHSFAATDVKEYFSSEKNLPRGLAPHEVPLVKEYLREKVKDVTAPPEGPVHSLGEWEESEAAMILWSNKSLIKALSENGNVKILIDNADDQSYWNSIIKKDNLDSSKFSYFVVQTDSFWIRDYGPWWIVDSNGKFGIVDTVYNRPRPLDDKVPQFIGRELDIPVYQPGLVHTGGNYYSDSLGNAFSSTLVFKENSYSVTEVLKRMLSYLGIETYTTSPLGEDITIEHLDTFGKLVAPDTWVFSEFDKDSVFYKDSERMVELLKNKLSPYGTPYKIYRLKMVEDRERYRAYINSFVSNGALYFPAYGDNVDSEVQKIYQQALPGYKIIGVDAEGTEWGDSVHCRTRNLAKRDTVFIFPRVSVPTVTAEIIARPGYKIISAEAVFLQNGVETERIPMTTSDGRMYSAVKNSSNIHGEFYISASDSSGKTKTHPLLAPQMTVTY